MTGDQGEYLAKGISLATTGQYGKLPHEFRMPGMPALVAFGYLAGGTVGARYVPRLVFAALATLATTVMWYVLFRDGTRRYRIIALLLLQFTVFESLFLVSRILPDLPAMSLGILAAAVLGRWGLQCPMTTGAIAGTLVALATYLRPDYLLLVPTLAATWCWIYGRQLGIRKTVIAAGFLVLCASVLLALWGIRNSRETGKFQIFSDHGVKLLWYGFHSGVGLQWALVEGPWLDGPEQEQGKIARREALHWMRAHPGRVAYLVTSRLASHLQLSPPLIVSGTAHQIPLRPLRLIFRAATVVSYECWLLSGIAALILGAWRLLPPSLVFLGAVLVSRLPVAAIAPEQGRFLLILGPFLAFCALWFFGRPERPPVTRVVRVIGLLVIALSTLRISFGLLWGWGEVLRPFLG